MICRSVLSESMASLTTMTWWLTGAKSAGARKSHRGSFARNSDTVRVESRQVRVDQDLRAHFRVSASQPEPLEGGAGECDGSESQSAFRNQSRQGPRFCAAARGCLRPAENASCLSCISRGLDIYPSLELQAVKIVAAVGNVLLRPPPACCAAGHAQTGFFDFAGHLLVGRDPYRPSSSGAAQITSKRGARRSTFFA